MATERREGCIEGKELTNSKAIEKKSVHSRIDGALFKGVRFHVVNPHSLGFLLIKSGKTSLA